MAVLDKGWRRIVSELGIEFLLPEAVELLRAAGQIVEDENRVRFDPEFILEQVAKAPREFELQARNPEQHAPTSAATTWCSRPSTGARSSARATSAATPRWPTSRTSCASRRPSPSSIRPGGTICEPEDRPLDSRHLDMVYALQTLSDKPYMGSVTSGPNAADTIRMGEILFGGREAIERAPVSISLINVNSPLRYDDRMLGGDVRVREGQPGGRDHPVPADGRDVAGVAARDAGPADGRGARRDRAGAADPPRRAGGVRVVPVEHRHAVGLAVVRHAGVGDRRALHRSDRAPLRAAVARRRRAERVADRRRPGRVRVADDAAADVPRRRELRHALGRLARGRAWSPATRSSSSTSSCCASCATSSRRWRSTRPRWPSTPTSRSAPAATSSARRTRSSASASASTGRCSPRPRTSTAGPRRAPATPPPAPARSGARRSRSYEQPPLDDGDPGRARGVRRPAARRSSGIRGPLPPRLES